MALSASTLKGLMKTQIVAVFAAKGNPVSDTALLEDICEAIATAVVNHITASAVVVPTALLAPPGMAGGPVTGTGTIT